MISAHLLPEPVAAPGPPGEAPVPDAATGESGARGGADAAARAPAVGDAVQAPSAESLPPAINAPQLEFLVGYTWIAEPKTGLRIAESCRWGLHRSFIFTKVVRADADTSRTVVRGFFGRDGKTGTLMTYSFGADGAFSIGHRMRPGDEPGSFRFHLHTYGLHRVHRLITMTPVRDDKMEVHTVYLSSDMPGPLQGPMTLVYCREPFGTEP